MVLQLKFCNRFITDPQQPHTTSHYIKNNVIILSEEDFVNVTFLLFTEKKFYQPLTCYFPKCNKPSSF